MGLTVAFDRRKYSEHSKRKKDGGNGIKRHGIQSDKF